MRSSSYQASHDGNTDQKMKDENFHIKKFLIDDMLTHFISEISGKLLFPFPYLVLGAVFLFLPSWVFLPCSSSVGLQNPRWFFVVFPSLLSSIPPSALSH